MVKSLAFSLVVSLKNSNFALDYQQQQQSMFLNYIYRLFLLVMMLVASSQMSAQPQCKDTAEHKRLQMAMWASCFQNDSKVVFDACEAYLAHTKADGNLLEASTSWVCSIMYSLGKMDISSAYHTTQRMKKDIQESKFAEEGKYFIRIPYH